MQLFSTCKVKPGKQMEVGDYSSRSSSKANEIVPKFQGSMLKDNNGVPQIISSERSKDQEFIDHTLLAPEYIRDSNNFMMEFIDQQVVFPKSTVAENDYGAKENPLSSELQFPNAIFQFVNKHGQIQCVVADEGVVALEGSSVADSSQSFNNKLSPSFITLNGSFLADPPSNCNELSAVDGDNEFVPLINSSLTAICDITQGNKESVTELGGLLADEALNSSNLITETDLLSSLSNARKVLPHKKRISKKLKDTEKTLDYTSTCQAEGKGKTVEHRKRERNTLQFNCELCDHATSSQIEFFGHLKHHYEPQSHSPNQLNPVMKSDPNEMMPQKIFMDSTFLQNKKFGHDAAVTPEFADVHINFEDFQPDGSVVHVINQRNPNDDMKILNANNINKCIQLVTQSDVEAPKQLVCSEEIEFSDTEDMLEGIRNVVDKVSVEDTCDAVDVIRTPWIPNNSFSAISFSNKLIGGSDFPATVHDDLLMPKSSLSSDDEAEFLSIAKPQEMPTVLLNDGKKVEFSGNSNVDRMPSPKTTTTTTTPTSELMLRLQPPSEAVRKNTKMKKSSRKNAKEIIEAAAEEEEEEDTDDKLLESEPTKRQFSCTHCNRKFNSKNALKYHNRTHSGVRPHQCDICGRSFFAQGALKSHVRTHTGDKPFDCDQCDRKFRQVGDLKYHVISVHNVDKSHQCEFCGKAFSRKYSLVLHRRIHTSERDYKCDFCPKSFRASIYLQSHRKIHTGEKPYQCEFCPKKFRVSGDLRRHLLAHQRKKAKYEKGQRA